MRTLLVVVVTQTTVFDANVQHAYKQHTHVHRYAHGSPPSLEESWQRQRAPVHTHLGMCGQDGCAPHGLAAGPTPFWHLQHRTASSHYAPR